MCISQASKLTRNWETDDEENMILISNIKRARVGVFVTVAVCLAFVNAIQVATAQTKFMATGPTQPVRQPPGQQGAVKVTFDLLPTTMSYDLPGRFYMVSENNISFHSFPGETYDNRHFGGTGGAASFEPLMDRENRYVRVWIEHQSDARIVVRVREALANNLYNIAHTDIPSGSPYGKGDWEDEWYYIYPDGTNIRDDKIYTGLAPMSRPFGFDRDPPKVVHEFIEPGVHGQPGHLPTDDMETNALTLIRLFGDFMEARLPDGKSTTISYVPYPKDFGDFRDANIMLVNLKAKYKPFMIAMPYGVRVQPYAPEGPLRYVFETWGWSPSSGRGYTLSLGHILNYWHYRRTDNTLEQIYFQGMTDAADPVKELVSLAWSWIQPPKLHMEGLEPSYTDITYDPAQKAYIVPRQGRGPTELKFSLEADKDGGSGVPMSLVNPAFIVKDWGESDVSLQIDSKPVERGDNFRVGYEETATGKDLIIWLKMKTSQTVKFSISPK